MSTDELMSKALAALPEFDGPMSIEVIHRLADKAVRQELYDAFLDEYRSIFIWMCDNVTERLDQLVRDYDLAPAPEDRK